MGKKVPLCEMPEAINISRGILSIVSCFTSYQNATNVRKCLILEVLNTETLSSLKDLHSSIKSEALVYLISLLLRTIEDSDVTRIYLIKTITFFLDLIDDCDSEYFCGKNKGAGQSLFDCGLIGFTVFCYTLSQEAFAFIEVQLWKSLLESKKNHTWMFVIELFCRLSKDGNFYLNMESSISRITISIS